MSAPLPRGPGTLRGRIAVALTIVAAVGAGACATTGGKPLQKPTEPEGRAIELGRDAGRGNVIAIQPFLHSYDYASTWLLSAKIENYLEGAKKRGWLRADTLVVLPEHVGTWLIAVDEDQEVTQARTVDDVRKLLSQRYFFDYWTTAPFADAPDKGLRTIFAIKGPRMASAYQKLFSEIAREYEVTLVAGSIVLPAPRIVGGDIVVDPAGPLLNAAFVFGPSGAIVGPPSLKVYPSQGEEDYLVGAPGDDRPVYETPAGNIGVLLGTDCFHEPLVSSMKSSGIDLLLSPASLPTPDGMTSPWNGLGSATPSDIPEAEIGTISGRDAWLRYGLPARTVSAKIDASLAVFSRGRVWDWEVDGHTIAVKGEEVLEAPQVDAPVVLNLWLGDPPPAPAETAAPAPEPSPLTKKKRHRGKKRHRKR